jgi:hypothetical protein
MAFWRRRRVVAAMLSSPDSGKKATEGSELIFLLHLAL